jgi:hypothetical protein
LLTLKVRLQEIVSGPDAALSTAKGLDEGQQEAEAEQ